MSATYVTTVQMNTFNLAPASPLLPRVDVLDLVIRLLVWLLALAIRLKGQPACCDNPKLKPQEQGYSWCTNCGAVFDDRGDRRPAILRTEALSKIESEPDFFAEIDRSMKRGYLI